REARDAGEAFEAGEVARDGRLDDVLPGLARRRAEPHARAAHLLEVEAAAADRQDEAAHALVGDDDVGASAEHGNRKAPRLGMGERLEALGLAPHRNERLRRAAELE